MVNLCPFVSSRKAIYLYLQGKFYEGRVERLPKRLSHEHKTFSTEAEPFFILTDYIFRTAEGEAIRITEKGNNDRVYADSQRKVLVMSSYSGDPVYSTPIRPALSPSFLRNLDSLISSHLMSK